MPVEILHLAFTSFPADPRVRREVAALRSTGRRVAVVALRESDEQAVEHRDGVITIRVPGRKTRRRADLTITVNHPIDELLATRPAGGSRPERRLVLHNTADPADYGDTPATAPAAGGPRLDLIYHGTLATFYGLDVAIRALARLR